MPPEFALWIGKFEFYHLTQLNSNTAGIALVILHISIMNARKESVQIAIKPISRQALVAILPSVVKGILYVTLYFSPY